MDSRKSLTEADLLAFLKGNRFRFPPLRVVEYVVEATQTADKAAIQLDALLTLAWQDRIYRFGVEARRLWSPKTISEAMDMVQWHVYIGQDGLMGDYSDEEFY